MLRAFFFSLSVLVIGMLGHSSAHASLIYLDSVTNGVSTRGAESSPYTHVTVSVNTTINQIGVLNDLVSNGNLKFLVFDSTTNNFALITSAKSFIDDGMSFKLSDAFAPVTLLTGHSYFIGAIADVGGDWAYNFPASSFTMNNITAFGDNGNVNNYITPTDSGGLTGIARIPLELFSPDAVAVPVPAGIVMSSIGILGLGGFTWLRRRKAAMA